SPLENDERFFMSCRGVLVNIEQVEQMEGSDFVMKNGERVPISQRNRQQARKAFFDAVFKM
ncbi:MAG: DNA-binding response regulator, partial [Oscillospiraceae bacterium]|nr:DNA-binding response regulator [Oscillospiraceae bacterium]